MTDVTDDRVYLNHIKESIQSIREFTLDGREAFMASPLIQAAVLYKLQTLAESTQRLSDTIRAPHDEVDWNAIRGFRNRLAHGYLDVNLEIVWNVVENALHPLGTAVDAMLESLGPDE